MFVIPEKEYPLPFRQILTVMMGVGVMILGSKLEIPMDPVPFTFQTVATLLIALTCSPAKAFLSLLVWISLAACGFPVFSGSTSMIMGPKAGYIWGMLLAVTFMSTCQFHLSGLFNRIFSSQSSAHSLTIPSSIVVGCLGTVIVLMMGWINLSQYVGGVVAWDRGVCPFLFLEFCKVIGVSIMVDTLQWQKIGR